MSETVNVEAARIPDRDRLLEALREAGLDAKPLNEVSIEVPCDEATEQACNNLLSQTEHLIMSVGAPFVPQKHDGVIYIRPPVS